ncbi:hypothetical protein SAMN05444159_7588 [Bradyrhizobium lablabi]|uniref:Uncharacterized protein n=2 Tax=Bradyrhizobium lablabi TaxID=722472 RepID=A0A1M7FSE5_9BRAD|nr:hypothetical protein SAMN05444159_7588 [Bradyrhizobium lablabi]
MSAQPQPATRNLGGRPPGINRRRKELVDGYVTALGGPDRVTPLQMVEIERAAGLTLLAQEMRAKALRGEDVAITDLTRLEGTLDRATRRLGLNIGAAAHREPVADLQSYLANKAAGGGP